MLAATPAADATPATNLACRSEVNSAAESGSETPIATYLLWGAAFSILRFNQGVPFHALTRACRCNVGKGGMARKRRGPHVVKSAGGGVVLDAAVVEEVVSSSKKVTRGVGLVVGSNVVPLLVVDSGVVLMAVTVVEVELS